MPDAVPVSVLIVDDQPRNLVALEAALASADYRLVTAHSGRGRARAACSSDDFAVIVLDVHMPEMDGFETASLIRARDRSQSTPIIFLTADDRVGPQRPGGLSTRRRRLPVQAVRPGHAPLEGSVFVELFRKTAALTQRTADLTTTTCSSSSARGAHRRGRPAPAAASSIFGR